MASENNLTGPDGESHDRASDLALATIDSALIRTLPVKVEAILGRTTITVEELMAIRQGSTLTLDDGMVDHTELYINDVLFARGEIVAVGDKFGVRITVLANS